MLDFSPSPESPKNTEINYGTTGHTKYINVYAMFTRKARLIIAGIRNKILFYRI